MGLFDRFKKTEKKEKPRKPIPTDVEIEEDQLLLKKIATTNKDRYEGRPPQIKLQINMLL